MLDAGEFTTLMRRVNANLSDEDTIELFRRADIDGSGTIDKPEFRRGFNVRPGHADLTADARRPDRDALGRLARCGRGSLAGKRRCACAPSTRE